MQKKTTNNTLIDTWLDLFLAGESWRNYYQVFVGFVFPHNKPSVKDLHVLLPARKHARLTNGRHPRGHCG